MDAPTISIAIPTIGRPTLARLIQEILPQLGTGDEVLVVGDGPQPGARAIAEGIDPRVRYYEYGPTRNWGYAQKNWAIRISRGDYLYAIDDDDRIAPTALASIRRGAIETGGRPMIFKIHHAGIVIWRDQTVRSGNISTQMLVFPNRAERLGFWGLIYEGDREFAESTLRLWPDGALAWREEVIALRGIEGMPDWNRQVDAWIW